MEHFIEEPEYTPRPLRTGIVAAAIAGLAVLAAYGAFAIMSGTIGAVAC